jgi:ferritin
VMRFYNFIVDRDGRVLLKPVGGPKTDWDSPLAAFEEAHKHEQKVTELINNLVKLAIEEKDFAVHTFLQWFITEQVEEEAAAWRIVQKLRLAGDNGAAMLMMDNELGQRTVAAAPAAGAAT